MSTKFSVVSKKELQLAASCKRCGALVTWESSKLHADFHADCGVDERYPTAAHILDCPIPASHQPSEPEPGQ